MESINSDCYRRFIRFSSTLLFALALASLQAADSKLTGDPFDSGAGQIIVHPINHATLAIAWKGKTIYVDPVGGADKFDGLPKPDLILITDIHGDHLNAETLQAVAQEHTKIIAPEAVAEKLDSALRQKTTLLANGQTKAISDIGIEAIPMYNLTADRLKFHSKGRGNGYVLTLGNKISTSAAIPRTFPRCERLRISMSLSYA